MRIDKIEIDALPLEMALCLLCSLEFRSPDDLKKTELHGSVGLIRALIHEALRTKRPDGFEVKREELLKDAREMQSALDKMLGIS